MATDSIKNQGLKYLIENDNPEHGRRICRAISRPFIEGLDRCLSRSCLYPDGTSELLGGVVYQDYFGPSVCMHVDSYHPHWLNRDFLWAVFDYPFNVMGVRKVIALVATHQINVLEFDRKLGFVEETRIADVVPGGDLIVLYMRREQCRWLVDKSGQPYVPRTLAMGTRSSP